LPEGGLVSVTALDQTDLLDIVQAPDLWAQYLAAVGLGGYRPRHTQTFDNAQVMYEARWRHSGRTWARRCSRTARSGWSRSRSTPATRCVDANSIRRG
jgi:hypothetical protein